MISNSTWSKYCFYFFSFQKLNFSRYPFLLLINDLIISVGTNMGDVMVYELPSHERIAIRNFKAWELGACSVALQV